MGLIELKSGARWQPAMGVSPDLSGLRTSWPPRSAVPKDITALAAEAITVLPPMLVSISLLVVLLGTIYLYADAAIPAAGSGLFTLSDMIVPLAFFLIQLTSRRHGPARALSQVLAALALCVVILVADPPVLRDLVLTLPSVTARSVVAFGTAFVLANLAGIAFFEAARGPLWWKAPACAALAETLVFSLIFYPLAGLQENWARSAVLHFAQLTAESALLLLPYWLLRRVIKPLPGLNGY